MWMSSRVRRCIGMKAGEAEGLLHQSICKAETQVMAPGHEAGCLPVRRWTWGAGRSSGEQPACREGLSPPPPAPWPGLRWSSVWAEVVRQRLLPWGGFSWSQEVGGWGMDMLEGGVWPRPCRDPMSLCFCAGKHRFWQR